MNKIYFVLIFFLATVVNAHFVSYCNIYDDQLNGLRAFPGKFCIFNEDGGFISATENHISRISPTGKTLWKKKMHVHHQINLFEGKILVISSQAKKIGSTKIRFDSAVILNINGNEIGRFDFYHHKNELNKITKRIGYAHHSSNWAASYYKGIKSEFSHLNSFHGFVLSPEIADKSPLAGGSFVLNSKFDYILVLDKSLKKIVWSGRTTISDEFILHDVQVNEAGQFMYYNNKWQKRKSAIEVFDPATSKLVWSYGREVPEEFFSGYLGTIQALEDNHYLFTDIGIDFGEKPQDAYVLIVNYDKRVTFKKKLTFDSVAVQPHQVRKVDLSQFLANNKIL